MRKTIQIRNAATRWVVLWTCALGSALHPGIGGASSNHSAVNAEMGYIEFTNDNDTNGSVAVNMQFHQTSFVSTSGTTGCGGASSTQYFGGSPTVLDTSTATIQTASSQSGQVGHLDLLPGGTQQIHYAGVSDILAIGRPLALDKSNQGGNGNALGWFGVALAAIQQVPALSNLLLGLLGAFLFTFTYFRRSRAAQKYE